MLKIAVDEDRAETAVRRLSAVADSLGEFEFGFQGPAAVGVAATDWFAETTGFGRTTTQTITWTETIRP